MLRFAPTFLRGCDEDRLATPRSLEDLAVHAYVVALARARRRLTRNASVARGSRGSPDVLPCTLPPCCIESSPRARVASSAHDALAPLPQRAPYRCSRCVSTLPTCTRSTSLLRRALVSSTYPLALTSLLYCFERSPTPLCPFYSLAAPSRTSALAARALHYALAPALLSCWIAPSMTTHVESTYALALPRLLAASSHRARPAPLPHPVSDLAAYARAASNHHLRSCARSTPLLHRTSSIAAHALAA